MKTFFAAAFLLGLTLASAQAADPTLSSTGVAIKDAATQSATQAAKDKAQEKLGTSTVPSSHPFPPRKRSKTTPKRRPAMLPKRKPMRRSTKLSVNKGLKPPDPTQSDRA